MPSPKVSIVVPIYNVEQYLEQCLDSLVNQTLEAIEILCINDGSTDSSPEILERFAAADPRIVVIHKPNSGYGASMNRGLDAARGEYIGIVESDDYVEPDMFERLYAAAALAGTPVVRGDYFFTWTEPEARDSVRSYYQKAAYNTVLDPTTAYEVFRVPPAIWSGIYERALLERYAIRFLESPGASFQDTGFNYKMLMATDGLYLLNAPFVHYRQDNMASSVKATSKIYGVVEELQSALDFLDQFPAKRATLRRVMQGIAYQTYRWNILRIAREHRVEFCEFMYSWFSAAREAGELERKYFSGYLYDEVEILLRNPRRYLRQVNSPLNSWLSKRGREVHFSTFSLWAALLRSLARRLGAGDRDR
ncbi:MAG: glycosyltransferase [Coriobacteriales bacterium]|nr:glycosyltransferase [Coriobacteriales bacterium]